MDNSSGAWGETIAAKWLAEQGFKIKKRNFHTRFGEIDIIAENRDYLVFAEVKTRKNDSFGSAASFVTASKQKKILTCAKIWLASHPSELQPRFDVIEIYTADKNAEKAEINWIENAF